MRVPPRRLTVLASLDVANYTRHVDSDERGTLSELAAIRLKIIRPTLAAHNGNLFKTMGDGALIEFTNVEDSVRWAMEFQTAMAARNAGRGDAGLKVRAGIGLADVFVQGQDRFGAAVGFVVRVQQQAEPGGIAVTHSVRWQLVKSLAMAFRRVDGVKLKGFEEPVELFMWSPPEGRAETATPIAAEPRPITAPIIVPAPVTLAPESVRGPDIPSIVVLPFDNMSGDPSAASIADGVVEEITASLSRVRDFTVIARNSAYAYKGRAVDVRQIARDLGVRYVIEGSLRKAGERVRVTAQLIDAGTGAHLWADRYDGVIENLFDFEDEIATRVTGALRPSIWDAEIQLARRKRPGSVAAYDLVLRALPHLWAHRQEDNAEAIRLLDQALETDPDYARAAAIGAWARAQHVVYNWSLDIEAIRAQGESLIARASPAVGDDPTALAALSTSTMLLFGDLDRARAFVERALALDPNHAWAWTRRGFLDAYRGKSAEAQEAFQKAIRLSPLDPFSFNALIGMGFAKFAGGEPLEAVKWARRALGEKVGMNWAYRDLAAFLGDAGQIEDARTALAQFTASRPNLRVGDIGDALRFIDTPILDRYLAGLRAAGLPD